MSISENLSEIKKSLPTQVTLVAVSKTKPVSAILEAYNSGQRIFGENKIQEMVSKFEDLPKDIEWHMIGHIQTNKVKFMAPFVALIHGVDSFKLLQEIDKQAQKNNRIIPCLLQVHIATEETKFGLDETELFDILDSAEFKNIKNCTIKGLMGMASFTDDETQVTSEFQSLKKIFDAISKLPVTDNFSPEILSMGMSGDYKLAIASGSNMVRIGSSIFGERTYF
ncbi:YggS family pyridoxal phosphate-dependent enzyme [Flavobacterium silvaticum]|uniref:Pyridoxal phosphate homeostasis protein n=1 Tax=Flavobacterium silvaticum TaxID=1852020 RepID=A0A972FN44_9FLAO|nr:YggS family pyridoxal phosphate-dependent enzyme [Flavobacterium silvaticum]NMH29109.1 YggS family pyridoxal phosphate-dependent enzyme [Flavobacterium silvaticum]